MGVSTTARICCCAYGMLCGLITGVIQVTRAMQPLRYLPTADGAWKFVHIPWRLELVIWDAAQKGRGTRQ